jgi:hypothetical protein
MSCSDPNKNNDAKKATYDTLNNIYINLRIMINLILLV